jgi:uncharacterized protein RhaS with RHS repeats
MRRAYARTSAELVAFRTASLQRRSSNRPPIPELRGNAREVCVARYYDPSTGQFLSIDPDVAQTLSPFNYAGDNPVNEIDPMGLANVSNYTETECELSGNRWVPKGSAPGVGDCVPVSQTPLLAQAWNSTGGNVVHWAATHTIGGCTNAETAGGTWFGGTVCLALVGGHPAIIVTLAGGGGSPSASGSVGFLVSNATTPQELTKWFATAGASVSPGVVSVGDEFSIGKDNCGQTIWENQVTVGTPSDIPFEFHGGGSYTWAW